MSTMTPRLIWIIVDTTLITSMIFIIVRDMRSIWRSMRRKGKH